MSQLSIRCLLNFAMQVWQEVLQNAGGADAAVLVNAGNSSALRVRPRPCPTEWGPAFRQRESELRVLIGKAMREAGSSPFGMQEGERRLRNLERCVLAIMMWPQNAAPLSPEERRSRECTGAWSGGPVSDYLSEQWRLLLAAWEEVDSIANTLEPPAGYSPSPTLSEDSAPLAFIKSSVANVEELLSWLEMAESFVRSLPEKAEDGGERLNTHNSGELFRLADRLHDLANEFGRDTADRCTAPGQSKHFTKPEIIKNIGLLRAEARGDQPLTAQTKGADACDQAMPVQGEKGELGKPKKPGRKPGRKNLEEATPILFQVYARIQATHQPGGLYRDTINILKQNKDFMSQVHECGLKLDKALVGRALATLKMRSNRASN